MAVCLVGPPFRWLLPDCRCFFTDNLYVKTAAGRPIDAYFRLPSQDVSDDAFWALNPPDPAWPAQARQQILDQVRAESGRRWELPETYQRNADRIAQRYVPRCPELFRQAAGLIGGMPEESVFRDEFLEAWRAVAVGRLSLQAPEPLRLVHAECFELPLFREAFVERLVEEISEFKRQKLAHQWPNNMNRAGLILNEIGLGGLMDELIGKYIGPVCAALYPRLLGAGYEAHHSFVVSYSMETDRSLGVHDDNSEVTVNVALTVDYTGAKLALYHHARVAHPQLEAKEAYHWRVERAGNMLLHPGEMLHEVLPLQSGDRMGLIIWLRSTSWRHEHGCPLCHSTEGLLYENGPDGKERPRVPITVND